MNCPCGSETAFAQCCRPIIKGERLAATPEELMRARYTAYTQVEMDFLFETLHPEHRDESDREGSRDWAEKSEWNGLTILETTGGGEGDERGTVEFIAMYTYGGDEARYHEVATFDKVDGAWYFTEGEPGVNKPIKREEPKVGRNDPCPCGSGKKFKKCCGR
ncbi:hypothetical protein CSB20_13710 [bacterium DOLZORAL124_64_63]|nr:MAG: hypothetical protein CSB20_13710 [bacterium DOLZORAL124_64_63]